jgi:hypothetical protein
VRAIYLSQKLYPKDLPKSYHKMVHDHHAHQFRFSAPPERGSFFLFGGFFFFAEVALFFIG